MPKGRIPQHGHKTRSKATRTYKSWELMKYRCSSPKSKEYQDYGARGITFCDRWAKFENFLADMGECPDGLFLDRVDNDGNYEPSNCKWSTRIEQNNNRRNNRVYELDGRRLTMSQWAAEKGISPSLLHARIVRLGWPVERAINQPAKSDVRRRAA